MHYVSGQLDTWEKFKWLCPNYEFVKDDAEDKTDRGVPPFTDMCC